MPARLPSPPPVFWPCTVGIDYWTKKSKKGVDNPIYYKYTDVNFDCDGWCDAEYWLPLPFDLCYLKADGKTVIGWWTGNEWDGLHLREKAVVKYWKKKHDET